mmetsp:Transcript_15182/g.41957  ORF Transcript_15182/g.41957 Transcript_15182/m.41957 type:complete len:207 (+) Transcript_15182:139-759(+)
MVMRLARTRASHRTAHGVHGATGVRARLASDFASATGWCDASTTGAGGRAAAPRSRRSGARPTAPGLRTACSRLGASGRAASPGLRSASASAGSARSPAMVGWSVRACSRKCRVARALRSCLWIASCLRGRRGGNAHGLAAVVSARVTASSCIQLTPVGKRVTTSFRSWSLAAVILAVLIRWIACSRTGGTGAGASTTSSTAHGVF